MTLLVTNSTLYSNPMDANAGSVSYFGDSDHLIQ